jgi:sialic acid synthase SpsE
LKKSFIIAEIGSNCFKYLEQERNLDNAIRQINAAKEHGADAVKFQLFDAKELWGPECEGTAFAKRQDKYAMPYFWLPELKKACDSASIEFMCSAFSPCGFDLVHQFVNRHKLASPEVRAEDICDYLFNQSKPVILSLGCVTSDELPQLINRTKPKDVILECVSKYPASIVDYDLYNIRTLAKKQNLTWGVSDHTKGSQLAVFARSKGATYFEKHVDFFAGEGAETPDSAVSITGNEFRKYVEDVQAQPLVDCDIEKHRAIELYARQKTKDGWYRPFPEGVSGI